MIEFLFSTFSTRELATIFWVAVFSAWAITKKDIRSSIWAFLKSVVPLGKFFFLLFLYIAITLLILYELSIWNTSLTKTTIYWVFGWSIIAFINSGKLHQEKGYLHKVFREVLNITILIAFFVNFYTFALWIELILVPFAVTLSLLTFFSGTKDEYKILNTFLNRVQIVFGTAIFIFCISKAVEDIESLASTSTIHELILPIYLSILLLPFLYALSWYARYEQNVRRQKFVRKTDHEQLKV